MTPTILLNLLHSLEKDYRVALTDFSLLIFDECHHTDVRENSFKRYLSHDFILCFLNWPFSFPERPSLQDYHE